MGEYKGSTPFDLSEHMADEWSQAFHLNSALESGNPDLIARTVGDICKARGMSEVARDAGVTREGLYKSMTDGGDPRISTLFAVLKALGYSIKLDTKHTFPKERLVRPRRGVVDENARPRVLGDAVVADKTQGTARKKAS